MNLSDFDIELVEIDTFQSVNFKKDFKNFKFLPDLIFLNLIVDTFSSNISCFPNGKRKKWLGTWIYQFVPSQ